MAKTGYDLVWLKLSRSSATTTFDDLSQYITEFSGIELSAETEESHAMGDGWAENLYTGLRRVGPITIGGFYDDIGTSGPNALMGNATDIGAEKCIKAYFGTTNVIVKQKVIEKRYNRRPVRGELTKYEAEFLPAASYSIVTT